MTRKIFGLKRRLLLLASLCVLWVYHSVSKRTRNFESSGLSDRTEETLTIPTRDGTSDEIPRPTITDGDYDPPPSRPVVAILPVTSSSFSHLSESLAGLSAVPHLDEIYLLCPGKITNAVRSGLRKALSQIQGFDHTEFFLTLWRDEWSEAESTLQVASNILSNDILILPQDALIGIDSIARDALFSRPPPLSVPLGLHGSGISCEPRYQSFSTAHFVLPPLLLPSRLEITNRSYLHLASWQEVGAHFAQVTGVGGVIPAETPEKTRGCRDLNTTEAVASTMEGTEPPPSTSDSKDLFVVLVAQGGDILALSDLACEFKRRGTGVQVFAGGSPSGSSTASSPTSDGCDVAFTQVPDLQDPTVYQLLGRSQSVVLTLAEYHLPPESPLDAWPTVIRIPRRDLPHSDWIVTLGVEALRNWHVPRVDISVITNDRPSSLQRLLQSLSDSRYFGDRLNIRINIEQDADYETLDLVDHWNWEHGSVFVNRRVIHAGLLPAVVESWYPHSNDSYGLILEDDVEVSPLFYAWLKMNLLRYRYGENQNRSAQMFGISLYQPKVIETRQEGRTFFNPRTVFAANDITEYTTPYLSQIPCSWGAIYFPEHWREFHSYLNLRFSEAAFGIDTVVVPDARSNRWSKSWKKYFIELAYLRGYVMLYPNYNNFVSLSTNHLEIGSHVKDTSRESYLQKKEMFRVPLMGLEGATRLLGLPHGTLPAFDDLPVLDLFGRLSSSRSLTLSGRARQSEIVPTCDPSSGKNIRPDFRYLLCAPPTE